MPDPRFTTFGFTNPRVAAGVKNRLIAECAKVINAQMPSVPEAPPHSCPPPPAATRGLF